MKRRKRLETRRKKPRYKVRMTHDDYARMLERLDTNNVAFCEALGIDERTGRRYLSGECVVPNTFAAIERLALRYRPLTGERLLAFLQEELGHLRDDDERAA